MASANRNDDVIRNIASRIYCRSICLDFRQPVERLYPHIMDNYLTIVEKPMDLGTILFKCMKNEYSAESLRDDLQLVFENALKFNLENHEMESISSHADAFSGALYEEALKLPYRVVDGISHEHFLDLRLSRRRFRVEATKRMEWNEQECRLAIDAIESFLARREEFTSESDSIIKNLLRKLVAAVKYSLKTILENQKFLDGRPKNKSGASASSSSIAGSGDQIVDGALPQSTAVPLELVTLEEIFSPVIKKCCVEVLSNIDIKQPALLNLAMVSPANDSNVDMSPANLIHPTLAVRPEYAEALVDLDEALGAFLALLMERKFRGSPISCMWLNPMDVVWAQPVKHHIYKNPWWVVMIVAAGRGCPSAPNLNDANLPRLPAYISQALRSKRSNKSSLNGRRSNPQSGQGNYEVVPLTSGALDDNTELTSASGESSTGTEEPPNPPKGSKEFIDSYLALGKTISLPNSLRSRVEAMLEPPDGQYLVEFLGTHDFYWVKKEMIAPFVTETGQEKPCPGSKVTNEGTLKEAHRAIDWIKSRSIKAAMSAALSDPNVPYPPVDPGFLLDVAPPSFEDLEASIHLSPLSVTANHIRSVKKEPSAKRKVADAAPVEVDFPNDEAFNAKRFAASNVKAERRPFADNGRINVGKIKLSAAENATIRRRALARTKVVSRWMSRVKPAFQGCLAVSLRQMAPEYPLPRGDGHRVGSSSRDRTKEPAAANFRSNKIFDASIAGIDFGSLCSLVVPEGGYHRSRIESADVDETVTAQKRLRLSESSETSATEALDGEGGTGKIAITNIDTYVTAVLAGDGVIHTKSVDLTADLLCYEYKSSDKRKQFLRGELTAIEEYLAQYAVRCAEYGIVPPKSRKDLAAALTGSNPTPSSDPLVAAVSIKGEEEVKGDLVE